MRRMRSLLTSFSIVAFSATFAHGHPGVSALHLDLEIQRLEEKLRTPPIGNGTTSGDRMRMEADLADVRFRYAIATGKTREEALVIWSELEGRQRKSPDLRFCEQLALLETTMRHAQAKGPHAEKAVVEFYQCNLKEMKIRLARAKHLFQLKCISLEEYSVSITECTFVQVCEAAVQQRHDLVIEHLQAVLNQRRVHDSGETAAFYRDIELEIERARQAINAGR